MGNLKLTAIATALLAGLTIMSVPTAGKAATYTFTAAGCAVCSATPIGTVDTSWAGGTETVAIQLFGNYSLIQAGNPPVVAFQITGAPVLAYNVTTPSAPSGSIWQNTGAQSGGATGSFNESLGFLPKDNTLLGKNLVFTFASAAAAVFAPNAAGYTFAVDLCTNGTAGSAGCSNGATGFAGATLGGEINLNTVPLPSAVLLFGSALLGMGVLGRRRKKIVTA